MTAPVTVTREDAIRFCNRAMRNWQYASFDEDELEDLRVELERHRQQAASASDAQIAELREALFELLDCHGAMTGHDFELEDIGIGPLRCAEMRRRAKSASEAEGV